MTIRKIKSADAALAFLGCLCLGCGWANHSNNSILRLSGVPVSVVVERGDTGMRLEEGFAGFSYEKSRVSLPLFNSGNVGLVVLFKRLGRGVLCLGGNSVNKTSWDPFGTGLKSGNVAPADIDRLAGFLRAADWKVIYGVNFVSNTAPLMADEAAYAAKSLGDRLFGFEIGNEPDLYHLNGLRPSAYTFADFLNEWRSYAAAIRARVPNAVFTGPASCCDIGGYTNPFATHLGTDVVLLTQHYYRANGKLPTSTIDLLLSSDPNLPIILRALKTVSSGIPKGYRLAEANSFYNGGAANVSNTHGTALWAIDFLFTNALNDSVGVNLHGGGSGPGYTPIADDGTNVVETRPEYYSMALTSMAAPGNILTTTTKSAGFPISSYAVDKDDGSTVLILVNKDRVQSANLSIDLGAKAISATLILLTGPSLESTTGTLLNGAAIKADGTWSPQASQSIAINDSTLNLSVPPASAMLARFRYPHFR